MKSKTLSTIANLLSSLQKRITETSAVAHQNADRIDDLGEVIVAVEEVADKRIADLGTQVEANRAQSFQRTEKIAASLAAVAEQLGPRVAGFTYPEGGLEKRHATLTTFVDGLRDDVVAEKKVNDDRETRQTLRDQNNVQALVNLKDSTQKAFDQVKTDVQNLIDSNSRLSTRLYKVEASYGDLVERAKTVIRTHVIPQPAPAPMPSDHVWVNKKLTGVYDTTTDLEKRLQKIEYRLMPTCVAPGTSWEWKRVDELRERVLKLEVIIKIYEDLRKAQLNLAEVNGAFLAGLKA